MTETAAAPIPTQQRRRTRVVAVGTLGMVGIAASTVLGLQAAQGSSTSTAASSVVAEPAVTAFGPGAGFGGLGGRLGGDGSGSVGAYGGSTSSGSAVTAAATATSDQVVGVVDITTGLGYQNASAAGTGMVLTSDGEVLTNNHVVQGATSITVTVLSTGATYDATVVGTDPTDDVAVLQLTDAFGLDTVPVSRDAAAIGDEVTAVGNAGGDVDSTSAAAGSVTALDQSITATDETGSNAEQLTGLIQIAADVVAGDSGGPLFDADGEVIGMDTAASSTGGQAYAVPITTALEITGQIGAGVDDGTVHQGYPAFLGVSLLGGTGGSTVAGVVPGGPADEAGLTAGDVLATIGGTAVTSADAVTTALADLDPGDQVAVSWTDSAGTAYSATVTLASGPAD
ncbi:serine protease, S1-C subfamily, contains C-terminal PDZ domain [Modestobacter sp. DSM 44400]|uniref:S1C family serine protease n=1 Tax=Modestobacter sp. DSM 44400 TaxID=1550230 RepID=UPI00089A02C1|nr:trypsin-like peptidase domain-containing protein [Modestobacter sp. DSM 44400]SDY05405.1 serine protease, S1-C subfamily, contains C-terminal PDZ domain [Modestobacter sp. DSM 44400]